MDVNWYGASDGMDRWFDMRVEQCDVGSNKWQNTDLLKLCQPFKKG
jgi:hypothetical protein